MNYRNPRLRVVLAGEYVLGTLRGPARRRFERLLRADRVLQRAVEQWQNDLYPPLIDALPGKPPPARVWSRVAQRTRKRRRRPPAGWWGSVDFWRGWALAASAALVALALWAGLPSSWRRSDPADYVAVLRDQYHHPAWLVRVYRSSGRFQIETLRPQARAADRSFELWLRPGAGQPRVALGLLPASGPASLTSRPSLTRALVTASGLTVSLEPAGGSPTNRPSGPVLYQGSIFATGKR